MGGLSFCDTGGVSAGERRPLHETLVVVKVGDPKAQSTWTISGLGWPISNRAGICHKGGWFKSNSTCLPGNSDAKQYATWSLVISIKNLGIFTVGCRANHSQPTREAGQGTRQSGKYLVGNSSNKYQLYLKEQI